MLPIEKACELYKSLLAKANTVLVDSGYSEEQFAKDIQEILGYKVEIAKRNDLLGVFNKLCQSI